MIFACDRDALMYEYYRNSAADESAGLPDWLPGEFGLIPLAAAVLYEMTWLVSSAEELHRRIEEFGEQHDC